MSDSTSAPRRERVERNICRRPTGVFEVGYKDASGKQRWRTVDGGITAARALRDQLVAQRNRREPAPNNVRLRFGDAADQWLAGPVADLRQTTRDCFATQSTTISAPASRIADWMPSPQTTWRRLSEISEETGWQRQRSPSSSASATASTATPPAVSDGLAPTPYR